MLRFLSSLFNAKPDDRSTPTKHLGIDLRTIDQASGQLAATECLGISLGDLASTFLGQADS